MRNHIKKNHEEPQDCKYKCNFCGFEANVLTKMYEHKFINHPDDPMEFQPRMNNTQDFILNLLAEQNVELMEELQTLKTAFVKHTEDMKNCFDSLEDETKTSLINIDVKIENIKRIKPKETSEPTSTASSTPPPTYPTAPPSQPPVAPSRPAHFRKKKKSTFLAKAKVLYIGDSVAHNVEFPNLEEATNCRIRTVKAYSSVLNEKARFPHKNVTDVTPVALMETHEDDEYTELVLSSPTVDISNLETSSLKPDDNTEVYKQSVVISCKNIFTAAEKALSNHPKLRQVVILEHPPRFDTKQSDPLGLKPQLAKYANMTYGQLWLASPLKDKIQIGSHSLKYSAERYTDMRTNRYDGIHMYGKHGRQDYTKSLIQMLKNVFPASQPSMPPNQTKPMNHTNCAQAKYQKQKKKTTFAQKSQNKFYNVPVNNRFNLLGN